MLVVGDGSHRQASFTGQILAEPVDQLFGRAAVRRRGRWDHANAAKVLEQRNEPLGGLREPVAVRVMSLQETLGPFRGQACDGETLGLHPSAQVRQQPHLGLRRHLHIAPRSKPAPESWRIGRQRPDHTNP